MVRDFRRSAHEEWSKRNQTLRHAGEKQPWDDRALLHNPHDYSEIGGPEDERIYGHCRSDDGYYPWNPYGGAYDRDTVPSTVERGGYRHQWGQGAAHRVTAAPSARARIY
jgi:hypothetical protein